MDERKIDPRLQPLIEQGYEVVFSHVEEEHDGGEEGRPPVAVWRFTGHGIDGIVTFEEEANAQE